MSWKSLETAKGVISPHPAPLPNAMGLHQAGTGHPGWHGDALWVQCPSVLFCCSSHSLPGSREQSPGLVPDIRKGILSFNRDRKVSALRTDMPRLSYSLSGSRLGNQASNSAWCEVGLQQDLQRVHTCPAGAGKGSESCVGPTGSPKAAGSTREPSRAGWQKDVVVALVARPCCALCWGTHIPGTPALPTRATLGKATSNTKMQMSGAQNAPARSSPGLSRQRRTTISTPRCSQNISKGSGEGMAVTAPREAGGAQCFWNVFSTGGRGP